MLIDTGVNNRKDNRPKAGYMNKARILHKGRDTSVYPKSERIVSVVYYRVLLLLLLL